MVPQKLSTPSRSVFFALLACFMLAGSCYT
jgi:hypothetical protein